MAGRCGCTSGCTCCSTSSPSIQVGGSGGAGQCFTSSVRYSGDAGNRARAGDDGGVYADTCLLTPAGDPLAPDGQDCLKIPAPVIRTYGSGPAGTVIAANPDGSVTLPTGGPPADYGCGLTVNEDDELVVATSGSWPPDDVSGNALAGAYTEGSVIACGPDGKIRGVPDHTAVTAVLSQVLLPTTLLPFSSTYLSTGSDTLVLYNPSAARSMLVIVAATGQVEILSTAGGGALGVLEVRTNGGGWANVREIRFPENLTADSIRVGLPFPSTRVETVAPGNALNVEARVRMEKLGAGTNPSLVRIAVGVTLMGVTV